MAASRAASGILVSRLVGFARESAVAHFFGAGYLADSWRAALQIPNVVQNLLGEGSLSASFVPVYVRLLEEGREEEAGKVAGAVLGLLAATAGGMALLGAWAAPWLLALVPGFIGDARADVVVALLRVLFPMTAVLALSAWTLGILNSHRKFFVAYVAPSLWSLSMLVVLVAFGTFAAGGSGIGGRELLVALAWGAFVGGVLQLLFQVPFAAPHLKRLRLSANARIAEVREVVRNFLPAMASRGVANLGAFVDLQLASWLAAGALARLGYARMLYVLPLSLFALSIAAAELPELSRDRSAGLAAVRARTEHAVARALFWLIPFAAGYMALRTEAMAVFQAFDGILGESAFADQDAAATGWVLAAFAVGLPATGACRVISSAFFSLGDTRTPAKIVAARMVVAAAAGAALMFPLDGLSVGGRPLGAVGLAAGAALGGWLELWLLRRRLRERLSGFSFQPRRLVLVACAASAAVAAGLAAKALLPPLPPVLRALGAAFPFALVYLAVAEWTGTSPVGVRGRIRRFRQ